VTHIKEERQKQLARAMMFDNLFKQAMLFIDQGLQEKDSCIEKERSKLLFEIDMLKREMDVHNQYYEAELKKQKDDHEKQMAEMKKKLDEVKKENTYLDDTIKEL
jgi:hypothetical protein